MRAASMALSHRPTYVATAAEFRRIHQNDGRRTVTNRYRALIVGFLWLAWQHKEHPCRVLERGRVNAKRIRPVQVAWQTPAVLAAACALVASVVLAGVERGQADTAQASADATSMAQQALALQRSDPPAAAQLALAAYQLATNPQTTQTLGTLAQLDGPIRAYLRADTWGIADLAQSPDGRFVYASSQNGALRAWSIATGTVAAQTTTSAALTGLALDPSGTVLTGIDSSGHVLVFNSETLHPQSVGPGGKYVGGVNGSVVVRAGFYADGSRYFALTADGSLTSEEWPDDPSPLTTTVNKMLEQAGQSVVSEPSGGQAVAADVSNGRPGDGPADTLYIATPDGRVLAVNLDNETAKVAIGLSSGLTGITSLALDPSGGTQLAVVANGTGGEYSLTSGQQISIIPGVTTETWSLGFDATNPYSPYYVLADDTGVDLVPTASDVSTSSTTADAPLAQPHGASTQAVAFPAERQGGSSLVAAGSANGLITLIDPTLTGFALKSPQPSTIAAFNSKGSLLLSGISEQDAAALAYSITPDAARQPYPNQSYAVNALYAPPNSWWSGSQTFFANSGALDTHYAVIAGHDPAGLPAILAWNATNGAPAHELHMPDIPSTSTSSSTTTSTVATAAVDDPSLGLVIARDSAGTIAAWSTTSWKPVASFDTGAPGGQIALTPDGTKAVVNLDFDVNGTNPPASAALGFIDLRAHTLHEVRIPVTAARIAISPTTGEIATQGADSSLRFYHPDGTPDGPATMLQGTGTGLAYNATGTQLAVTAGRQGTIVLDAATKAQLCPQLPAPPGGDALEPEWSPNGDILAVLTGIPSQTYGPGELAGSPQLWDMKPQDWKQRLHDLTRTDATLTSSSAPLVGPL